MQNPYYDMTVPIFTKMLTNLDIVLDKGFAHTQQVHSITETELLEAKLAPDMFPLVRQIQIATDNAKACVARLSGGEAPVMEDSETTVAALKNRIAATITYINSVAPAAFAEATDRQIDMKYFPGKYLTGADYFTSYALPNFFFHVTTSYAILRMNGVALGKADFLGTLNLKDVAA